ncbi:MAG TPA: class I SAM-dependent methyltransferase, partial [Gemmatimonadaceae bacterium]|nr:class I SAM-dependent methyltransferase [Gemmatimonadaceae bacterium]
MLLRLGGRLAARSAVMEIGCGVGRVAFALRYILAPEGRYTGFEIVRRKVEFTERHFHRAHPNFRFVWADVHNTHYNPRGRLRPTDYAFPAPDASQDLVFAASVFTHMLPDNAAHYFRESARVLRPGGRCVFSFFLLDHYRPGAPRPLGFARADFAFDHAHGGHGDAFAVAFPADPERMTAYRRSLVERMAADAGLRLAGEPFPGLWSGAHELPVGAQDVVVLELVGAHATTGG